MSIGNLTAFIFARGGSKGVKNKNIREVGGQPLISYAITSALECKYIENVIVSTDSRDIATISEQYGAEILMRPANLAKDDTPEISAWKHAIESKLIDSGVDTAKTFISVPATSPLRSSLDIENAINRFYDENYDVIFGITPSHRNPYLNMVSIDDENSLKIAIENKLIYRRQDVPTIYDITTCIYVADPVYVMACKTLTEGKVGYVMIPIERSIDIDSEYDLYLADLMLKYPFNSDSDY